MDMNGIDFSVVVDFIAGAIGFVILGIAVALVAVQWRKGRNNALIGIMFGIGMGLCFGMSLDNWLFGISLGVLWSIVMTTSLQNGDTKNSEDGTDQGDTDTSKEDMDKDDTFQE